MLIKRYAVLFLSGWLLLLVLNCTTFKSVQKPMEERRFGENMFFTLDFTDPNVTIQKVKNWFFTDFPHDEPTRGRVIYDQQLWKNKDIIQLKPGDGLYLYIKSRGEGEDYDSFRLTSKPFYNITDQYSRLLFVFKGELPSAKGIWPAWWLNGSRDSLWLYEGLKQFPQDEDLKIYSGKGPFYETSSPVNNTDWPAAGEIDIIEMINGENIIHNTLHTCPNMCDAIWNADGKLINCANPQGGDPNAGCSGKPYKIDVPAGTFACLWEKNRIKFYYWNPEENVRRPGGPLSNNPNPAVWEPEHLKNEVILLDSKTPCNEELHRDWQCMKCKDKNSCELVNMKMIFNATVCGLWAGSHFDTTRNAWNNCIKYVQNEGKKDIHNRYMKIEYVSVKPLP